LLENPTEITSVVIESQLHPQSQKLWDKVALIKGRTINSTFRPNWVRQQNAKLQKNGLSFATH
jgi:hypothetical protein